MQVESGPMSQIWSIVHSTPSRVFENIFGDLQETILRPDSAATIKQAASVPSREIVTI